MDNINKKTLSVIVAIYNVEKYLAKCIESIQAQTYRNLEIILIDDGSSDKSGEICDKYALEDERIKVVHRENKGVSYTRSQGIRMATGEYITFVDSDDYIHPQMYQIMLGQMQKSDADIVTCNYKNVTDTENVKINDINQDAITTNIIESKQERKRYIYLEKYVDALLFWNKIFKRELWTGIEFPEGKIYEDEVVTFQLLHSANKIVMVNEQLYYYVKRSDNSSITTISFSPKRLLRLDALEARLIYYIKHQEWEFLSEAFFVYKTDFLVIMEHILNSSEYKMDMLKPYMKKYRNYCIKYLAKMQMPAKKKLQYIFFAVLPMTYYKRYKSKK